MNIYNIAIKVCVKASLSAVPR